jgi:hypothetical protein
MIMPVIENLSDLGFCRRKNLIEKQQKNTTTGGGRRALSQTTLSNPMLRVLAAPGP